jgi:UDP-glucose 4-epimerase
MDKTIAVTGASGFIGTSVLRKLAQLQSTRILAISRSRPTALAPNVEWIESCLSKISAKLWDACGVQRLDGLIHLGAFTPKSGADRNRVEEIYIANIVGSHALLSSLPSAPSRIVFCSTLDVYAPEAFSCPIAESAPTGPEGLYGASKLFGEALVRAFAEQSGAAHVALRLGHVYGPGEGRYRKLIPETIRRVLAGQPPRIVGDGRERRDFLYVDDAAEAIVRAMSTPLDATPVINVASGTSYEVREVAALISAQAGYAGRAENLPATAAPRSIAFDTGLMERVLGRWTLTALEDGLKREIAWFRENA